MNKEQAREVALSFLKTRGRKLAKFVPDTRTPEQRIAQLEKNVAILEARGNEPSNGLAAMLRKEIETLKSSIER